MADQRIGRKNWPRIVALRKQKKTYAEIGGIFHVSRERVRQIIKAMEPKLTGYYANETATCGACNRQNHPGRFSATFSLQAQKQNISLCRTCWPRYSAYRRHKNTTAIYYVRYHWIKAQLADGIPAYKLGWIWKRVPPPLLRRAGEPCVTEVVWSHRIRQYYDRALTRIHLLEAEYPWVKDCYAEFEEDTTDAPK